MTYMKAPFTHYSIDESGVVSIAKTRRHSPVGDIIPQRVWRGMLRVKLTDDTGKPRQCWVHNLVWNTFAVEPVEKGERLIFIDGNIQNVHFDNLAVVKRGDLRPIIRPDSFLTPKPIQALMIGAKKSDWKGSANPNAKLSDYEAACIRFFNKRITQVEMAERLCVSQATISHVITNKTWTHISTQDKPSQLNPQSTT